MKNWILRVLSIAMALLSLPTPTVAQASWQQQQWQRQQQQQMQRQQQQQRQQQAADAARRAQQAADTARRSQQAAEQSRRNQATSNRFPQGSASTASGRSAAFARTESPVTSPPSRPIRGANNRNVGANEGRGFTSSGGIAKLTRPLTPGEVKKGYTGKRTSDGRALVKYQGRVFAVPALGIGVAVPKSVNQNSRWTPQQRGTQAARLTALTQGGAKLPGGSGGGGGGGSGGREKQLGLAASKMASVAQAESRRIETKLPPRPVTPVVVAARKRAAAMLRSNVGYNISSISADRWDTIGRKRTYLTDIEAVNSIMSRARQSNGRYVISTHDAASIEREFGLDFGTLKDGIKIREISDIKSLNVTKAEDGNRYYRGSGKHLPAGHPELTVDPVSRNAANVSVIGEIYIED